jgi:hypothetical protein
MAGPSDYERFAIVRINGSDKPPAGAVAHGSWPDVSQYIPDSATLREKISILNDAAATEARFNAIHRDISAREDALRRGEAKLRSDHAGLNHDIIGELSRRIGELEIRFSQWEAKKNRGPDDDMPPPPGEPSPPFLHAPPDTGAAMTDANDDGELEAPKAPTADPSSKGDPPGKGDRRGQFLRLDETEFPGPPLPAPPVVAQPIAAGLDEE